LALRKNTSPIIRQKGIEFFPVEKKVKYVPPSEDIDKVIAVAEPVYHDMLWTARETMARISEVLRLKWDDIDLEMSFCHSIHPQKEGRSFDAAKGPDDAKAF
jgi:integrase